MIHVTYNQTLSALEFNFPYDSRVVLIVKRIFLQREFIQAGRIWRVPAGKETGKLLAQFEKTIANESPQEIKIDPAVHTALEVFAEWDKKNYDLSDSIDYRDEAVERALGGTLTAPQRVAAAYLARNARGAILNTLSDERAAWGAALALIDLTGETPGLVICKNKDTWAWLIAVRHLTGRTAWLISEEGEFTKERNMYAKIKGEKKEICVIDYASLENYKSWLMNDVNWKIVIIDEAQALAHAGGGRMYKIVYDLLQEVGRRILISHLDLNTSPWLVYKLLLLIRRTADFGMGEWPFQVRYCGAWEERGKKSLGEPRNLDELRRRLKELCWIDFNENPFATGEDIERGQE